MTTLSVSDTGKSTNSVVISFDKETRDRMLARIKEVMSAKPRLGNFHTWYYQVYRFRSTEMPSYLKAIQDKYDELGLQKVEPIVIFRETNVTEQ